MVAEMRQKPLSQSNLSFWEGEVIDATQCLSTDTQLAGFLYFTKVIWGVAFIFHFFKIFF